MLSFPNAKINLGLNIISKRPDGYHNIESCFYPIPWCDALEIIESEELKFTTSGLEIPGTTESNLCLKAYHLVEKDYQIPPVHIHLHKVIPMGAGLGGGSSDGAFTLKVLNELFELGIDKNELQQMAGKLGSDCPFFIENKPTYVSGTGGDFQNIDINLSGKHIALKNPGIHIGTQEAYAGVTPKPSKKDIREIISNDISHWKTNLHNDFEDSIFPNHPQVEKLKKMLYDLKADYASMTGSGSTVYGIFEKKPVKIEDFEVFELA